MNEAAIQGSTESSALNKWDKFFSADWLAKFSQKTFETRLSQKIDTTLTRLLVFGAVQTNAKDPSAAPEVLEPQAADNYRRWWNNSWYVVEPEGQLKAGEWTAQKEERLQSLVRRAHANSLWIRFYTLDGATKAELSCNGWFRSYNFGSKDAVKKRWAAAAKTGVDYIASDQYEELGAYLKSQH